MTQKPETGTKESRTARLLYAPRLTVRTALIVERLWPLLVPTLVVVALFLAASWFGLFRGLSEPVRLALLTIFAITLVGTLSLLRHFRFPAALEIDRRIEAANQLAHSPVQVQFEKPGPNADDFANALWREHQKRLAQKLRNLSGDGPRPNMPARDPWALRSIAVLLLATAFAYSHGTQGGRVSDAFHAGAGFTPVPPRIDAWVTPPAYTGKAPLFLTSEAHRETAMFTVPEGSTLTLRVTGGSGAETLEFEGSSGRLGIDPAAEQGSEAQAAIRQFSMPVNENGNAVLQDGTSKIASWAFTVIPDNPPVIRFSNEPTQAVNGTLTLQYEIIDDYGATSAEADFALADPQDDDARPLYEKPELKLTLPRRGATPPVAKVSRDLTEHVWAGAKVSLTLQASDAAGQIATSETKTFFLPERPFVNPLAKAVAELRRIFSLDANRKNDVLDLIDAITLRPEDTIPVSAHFLGLSVGKAMLENASSDEQLREASDYFWELALGIEDGELSSAERRLKQAREALKQALERGADDAEIDRLMKELREAMSEFLRQFAERAQRNPNMQSMPFDQTLREQDLQKMLDEIERQAKSGNRDAAEDLLAQLEEMMNNLQTARPQQGESGEQSEMRQQMNKLGEIMRRQQEMMNETHRLEKRQQQSQQGMNGEPMTPQEFADAMRQLQEGQGALQRDLQSLMEGLKGSGIEPGEGFGEAGEQMGEAQGALGQGEGERATGHQGQALEALRRGAQNMMQQMQQAMDGEQGDGQEGGRQQQSDRDPLGRPRATRGPDEGTTTRVPDEIDAQRAREILEAIRKRLGNALSPEIERRYLERLLEMQ